MLSNKQEKLLSETFLCTTEPLITGNNFYFWSYWNVNNQSKIFSRLCLGHSTQESYYLATIMSVIVNLK